MPAEDSDSQDGPEVLPEEMEDGHAPSNTESEENSAHDGEYDPQWVLDELFAMPIGQVSGATMLMRVATHTTAVT